MRALNCAIEDAAAFTAFRDALTFERQPAIEDLEAERRYLVMARRPGENRADWRRRMKTERKAAKAEKRKAAAA